MGRRGEGGGRGEVGVRRGEGGGEVEVGVGGESMPVCAAGWLIFTAPRPTKEAHMTGTHCRA